MRLPSPRIVHWDGVLVAQVAPVVNAHPLRWLMRHALGRRLAEAAARAQLMSALVRAGVMPGRDELIVVCSNVFLIDAARVLDAGRLVVDICDDPRYFPDEPPWTEAFLRRAVLRANVVTTSSRSLEAEFVALGARKVVYVPNGIHHGFAHSPVRSSGSQGVPVLGFAGHVGQWVDLELLDQLARELPGYELRIIGSVAREVRAAFGDLLRYPNVRYTPRVDYSTIPGVLAGFSVGLIPFRLSPYARAVNPLKLYEYAALDLPVVSTPFSPDVTQFSDSIDVCATAAEFVRVARERASGIGNRRTRPIAEAHFWERIGDAFLHVLEGAAG